MKICIVCPSVYPLFVEGSAQLAGGAEAQLKALGIALSNHDYDVSYIVDDFGQSDIEKVGKITFYKVPLRYMGGKNIHIFKDWFDFIYMLRKINADVHLIKVPRNILLPLTFYAVTHGKKAVYIGQSDIDSIKKNTKARDGFAAYWFYRIGLYLVTKVVSQTVYQQCNFKGTYSKVSTVIPNVVTLPGVKNYAPARYVLWVGNSAINKQPELFLDVAEKLPDIKFKMIMSITNDRNDVFIRNREKTIPNLEYLGFVPFQHIEKYYEGAALLVCTSIVEGFPNTFLQSWQYGAPVISLTFDPDGVIDKHNLGKVSGTLPNLINDVSDLMGDETKRKGLAINSLQYIEKNHSVESSVNSYIQLFEEMGCYI